MRNVFAIDVRCRLAVIVAIVLLLGATSVPARDPDTPAATRKPTPEPTNPLVIKKVLPQLDKAVELVDRREAAPAIERFGEDKKSITGDINELLDVAIDVLSDSKLSETRTRVRETEAQIEMLNDEIVEMRQQRALAPAQDKTGHLARLNPFLSTREEYDQAIEDAEVSVRELSGTLSQLRADFGRQLRASGLDVSEEAVDALLSTVSGDDFITMSVVFGNVSEITTLLRSLTEQSNESPRQAKRYYGMYVVLASVLDRIQKQYVTMIRDNHVPKLQEYEEEAKRVIRDARGLIETNGGDPDTLRANIRANEITIDAARNYQIYLRKLAAIIEEQNAETERVVATALNTYRTVNVSSNVSELIRSGSEAFEKIMSLEMPPLRAFENAELRMEYQRLTERMRQAE